MDFSGMDDEALLRVIAGIRTRSSPDPVMSQALSQAVGALYDRYGRLVYAVAIHVVGDPETAEEITQDVFIRAWEGAPTYRAEMAKVSSWLVSIARHRAIDELRKRSARSEKDIIDWPDDPDNGAREFPSEEGPEDGVEASIQSYRIRRMIRELPQDQRQVLGLASFEGLSHSEIASRLNQPLGTVKSRIRLAMNKLREVLSERGVIDG